MPVISFTSPKGGAGKTTASLLLATELAQKGISVTIIDCDPRQWCMKWAKDGSVPATMNVEPKPPEDGVIDAIDAAKAKSSFVVVDLEGSASMLVAMAISASDFVIIPTQAGPMEGDSAADAIKLIKQQEKALRRKIPFAVLMTRMSAVIRSNIEKELTSQLEEASIPIFQTQLLERNAFKQIIAYKCPLSELPKTTYKLDDAIKNARSFAGEVIAMFKAQQTDSKEVAA